MNHPVTILPTLEFAFKNNRAVNLSATLASVLQRLPTYVGTLCRIHRIVRQVEADVILNFFEPLTGIYALTHRRRPPVVAVGHQFMLEHPDYLRAPGMRMQQFGMKCFVRLVGAASTKIALSLYEIPDQPHRSLFFCPPLLRKRLFEIPPRAGDFLLIYLLNHGYSEHIIKWHQVNPHVVIHCFYDKPGAPPELRHDDKLTFHRLDGEKFLRLMAECKFVVCTAGFESVCEAAYLGKPLFVVPVENHVEQQINALDSVRAGLGITDRTFNLDRLTELPSRLDNTAFRAWLHRAQAILFLAMQHAIHPGTHGERQASSRLA